MSLVNVHVESLLAGWDLSDSIAKAFGTGGLGALTVSGVPGLPEARAGEELPCKGDGSKEPPSTQARRRLLPLVPRLASLPEGVLKSYEDAESSFAIGWSQGAEVLSQHGTADVFKGSFYANPFLDCTSLDPSLAAKFPAYSRPNIWPTAQLPELEPAFKDLGKIIYEVGLLILDQCDRYVASVNDSCEAGKLRRVVLDSRNHKARLLHYFPVDSLSAADDGMAEQDKVWCGWHTDLCSLTGLSSAMYIKDGIPVANPDPDSGLYIRVPGGAVVKAIIPEDSLAFQVGDAMQIHSGGLLRSTPHYVKSASRSKGSGVSRSTMAVFMQPDVLEALDSPPGVSAKEVAVGKWKPGASFGEFAYAKSNRIK